MGLISVEQGFKIKYNYRFYTGSGSTEIFQLLHTCVRANFAYVSKCVHMDRFAYVFEHMQNLHMYENVVMCTGFKVKNISLEEIKMVPFHQ